MIWVQNIDLVEAEVERRTCLKFEQGQIVDMLA